MKTRTLKTGEQVAELDKPVTLTVYTKCPEKYMLVDRETGECYTGYATEGKNSWKKSEPCQIST
jgi:hypothetical protein